MPHPTLPSDINQTTTESEEFYTVDSPIWKYAAPILIIVGLTENCLSVVILSRGRFSHIPSRVTLVSLAVVDCVVLFVGLIRYWLNVTFNVHPVEWSNAWCKIVSTVVLISSHLSSCLVALLSVERFFAVFLPHHRFKPTIDTVGTIVLVIFCFGVDALHFRYSVLELKGNETLSNETEGMYEQHRYACTSENDWVAFWQDIADISLLFGLPFVIIVACNTYIMYTLRQRSNRLNRIRNSLTTSRVSVSRGTDSEGPVKKRTSLSGQLRISDRRFTLTSNFWDRNTRITITLLCITFAFLLCNLPFALVHILRTADESRRTREWNNAWLITYILVYVNNCLNFPIYVMSHPQFREELRSIFCCLKLPCMNLIKTFVQ